MNIQPKIEPGSPSASHIIHYRDENETSHNFEEKTIADLVEVLRVAYLPKTFDTVEAVLLSREMGLRDQIQLLQQNVEMEKLARLKAEEEVKKRERVSEEGKKLEQRYITLLKELKRSDLASDRDTIDILRKRNIELKEMWGKEKSEVQRYEGLLKEAEITHLVDRDALKEVKKKNIEFECEVKKLEEKKVEDENELKVLKSKNDELESRVLELKEKRVGDENALDMLRKMKDELEHQVLELKGKKAEDEKSIDVLKSKNGELESQVLEFKGKRVEDEGLLKEAKIARLVDRDALEEMKKKNIEFECEVKKLEEKRVEDGNELRVLKLKNGELESQVLKLKEKIAEDENALDVLRKMKDGLEYQVLELKGKKAEDEKSIDVLKSKNGELESQVLEFKKLKEKWEKDTNELGGIREKNFELENEVLELKKLKKKWLNDSNALEELQSKVRVLEDDKKALAEIEIENGELKESVNNNLATISKLENENNNWHIKFYGLVEKVAKMEDDTKLLMSVYASWGGKNEWDPHADPMVAEFGNDTVQAASVPGNEDAQPQNIGSKDAQGASSASGRLNMEKDIDDDQHMSRGVHEKNAISGIAAKNGHPTPSSSTAVDMSKRKPSIADTESSSSGSSSCDLWYLNNLASMFEAPEAKKKKM